MNACELRSPIVGLTSKAACDLDWTLYASGLNSSTMSLRQSLALLAASFRSRTRKRRFAIALLCLFVAGLIVAFLSLIE